MTMTQLLKHRAFVVSSPFFYTPPFPSFFLSDQSLPFFSSREALWTPRPLVFLNLPFSRPPRYSYFSGPGFPDNANGFFFLPPISPAPFPLIQKIRFVVGGVVLRFFFLSFFCSDFPTRCPLLLTLSSPDPPVLSPGFLPLRTRTLRPFPRIPLVLLPASVTRVDESPAKPQLPSSFFLFSLSDSRGLR